MAEWIRQVIDGMRRSWPAEADRVRQATVCAGWDAGDGALTYLCEVDGRSYRRPGYANPCPSVLYVLPGEHRFGVESHRGPRVAVVIVGLRTQAARTYEISVDSRAE